MESSLKIEFAKKVVISLVKSPIYKEVSPNTDEEIKSHFKVTRQYKVNDFFHLNSLQDSR